MLGYLCKIKLKTCLFSFVFLCVCTICVYYYLYQLIYRSTRENKIPILLWWTPFLGTDEIISCQNNRKCTITKNRIYVNNSNLKAFLFYGSSFKPYDLPHPRSKTPWVIYHEESPKNLAFFLHREGQNIFNITSTFSRHSNFPLTLQYLKSLDSLSDTKYFVNTKRKNEMLSELSPILYIHSDCETPTQRDSYVQELMKYIDVDSYGSCLNNKELPNRLKQNYLNDPYNDDFMHFIARYKFIITIENSACEDYITEKLWRPLMAGSVPIYHGSRSVTDWLPNDDSAILIKKFGSAKKLAEYVHEINKNDSLYESFLHHKMNKNAITNTNLKRAFLEQKKDNFENPIHAFLCYVCENYDNFKSSTENIYECPEWQSLTEENPWESHWKMGKCEIKAFKYFTDKLKLTNFTQRMFEDRKMKYFIENDCSY